MTEITITKKTSEPIPYRLLLLADPSENQINRYLPQSTILLAKMKQEVIGVLAVKVVNGKDAEIMNVAIDPRFQNQGIASALIREAIELATASFCSKLAIATADSSKAQLRLYRKLGFKRVGKIPRYFIDSYETSIFENGKQAIDMIRLEMSLT